MGKRGKWLCLLAAALLLALGLWLWYLARPQPVVPENTTVWPSEVEYVTYLGEDVTDRIDPAALLEALQEAQCRNDWWRGYPDHPGYPPEEYRWAAAVNHGPEHFYISLGDSRSYRTTNLAPSNSGLVILEPEQLETALLALLS